MKKYFNHTFVVCAYKKSYFLEECIESLLNQTVKSKIIITTSTPNDHIENIANKYKLPLYINNGKSGIGEDWNFGVSQCKTKYVTIAHQDDTYEKDYLKNIIKYEKKTKNPVIFFTKYYEIKNGEKINLTRNLKIKELMLWPFKIFKRKKFIKRLILSFGSPICCPSVTINTDIVGFKPYKTELKCNLDWDTWVEFIKYKGSFVYIPKYLMNHRIHEESATSNLIENNVRIEEDLFMFKKFWPNVIAIKLVNKYKKALSSNKLNI